MAKRKGPNPRQFVLNVVDSVGTEHDWSFEDAVQANAVTLRKLVPKQKDLRERWWAIDDQGSTGACVGFATAYGVLRWHFVKAGIISTSRRDKPSARFIWMADKETDDVTSFPTTFIDSAGTQTKLALNVARNYGCVRDKELPMSGKLSGLSSAQFYALASKMRISSYFNLGRNLDDWRKWIAFNGPILTRLGVDRTWDRATDNGGVLNKYYPNTVRGGHAVCLVGYTEDTFIVRNSWSAGWGHRGFAYASDAYAAEAFTEAYGAVL